MSLGRKQIAPAANDLLDTLNDGWEEPQAQLSPHREPSAKVADPPPPQAVARRKPRRRAAALRERDDWTNQVIAEGFFLTGSLLLWGINALFTVLGVMAVGGPWWLGVLAHLGISRGEVYLWHRWRDPVYLSGIVFCITVDIGSTLLGALPLAQRYVPWLLGETPTDLRRWGALLSTPAPDWWLSALVIVALASLIAIGAERLVRKFWNGLRETWELRPVVA